MQESFESLSVLKDELNLDKSFSFIMRGHSVVLQSTMHVIAKKVLFCFQFGIIILKGYKEEDRSVKSLSESLNGCQKWHKEDHTLDYIPVTSFLRRLLFQLDSVVWSFFQLVLQQSHYVENSSTELHLTSSFWIESTSDGITLWLNQKN